MYQIEKGIPIPKKQEGKKKKYPFSEMEIGDSFFVANEKNERIEKVVARMYSAAKSYSAACKIGAKFEVRIFEEGVRVWRAV